MTQLWADGTFVDNDEPPITIGVWCHLCGEPVVPLTTDPSLLKPIAMAHFKAEHWSQP